MVAQYALSNGNILSTYIWSELLFNPDASYKEIEISFKDKKYKKELEEDSNGKFFIFEKEKIYLKNYLSKSFEEIWKSVKENPNNLKEEDLYWSLLNHFSSYYFFMDVNLNDYTKYKLEMKDAIEVKSICKLDLNGRYSKSDWQYKVSFKTNNENTSMICSIRDLYFSDFVSLIRNGSILILSKAETNQLYERNLLKEKENKKLFNVLKRKVTKEEPSFILI